MKKKRILIVDDEPQSIDMFKIRLESAGYEVFGAINGSQALDLVDRLKPDLVLLDIMLPDIGGFEICRAIKVNEDTKHTKIIVYTNKLDKVYTCDARESWADEMIEKMVDTKIFLKTIERVLG